MPKKRTTSESGDKIELQMTPMIDIVFQLLVFFIMTFKIVAMEGDFSIKMPQASPNQGSPDDEAIPPMRLRLTADENGNLASISVNDSLDFDNFSALHDYIIGEFSKDEPDEQGEPEIELDCDYQLKYEHVIAAITAVSGYKTADGEVRALVEKIKFSPPKEGPGS